jgi:hypothetical protein
LKKQLIAYEIEIEYYKEQLKEKEGIKATNIDENSPILDKQFYDNLRVIKELNDQKQRETIEKYDRLIRNLAKENRNQISTFKKISIDNKNRILNGEEEEEVLSLNQVEEQFVMFENRIKLLYEELRNKEKYILVVEQKYEMTSEENRCLKKKLVEEKDYFLYQVDRIKEEKDQEHRYLIGQIRNEISEKKDNLQIKIDTSLIKSQEFISLLTAEKERLAKMIEDKDKIISEMLSQHKKYEGEKEQLQGEFNKAKKEIRDFSEVRNSSERNIKQLAVDKEVLNKTIEDMNLKLNDILIKNVKLEHINKSLVETSYETKKEELDKNYKLIIDKLKFDIIDLEKQVMSIRNENESDAIRLKTTLLMNEKLNTEIEKHKQEINEKNTNIKIFNKNVEEASDRADRLRIQLEEDKNKIHKKEEEIKNLIEKNIMKETEVKSIRLELDRLIQNKEKQNHMSKYS